MVSSPQSAPDSKFALFVMVHHKRDYCTRTCTCICFPPESVCGCTKDESSEEGENDDSEDDDSSDEASASSDEEEDDGESDDEVSFDNLEVGSLHMYIKQHIHFKYCYVYLPVV